MKHPWRAPEAGAKIRKRLQPHPVGRGPGNGGQERSVFTPAGVPSRHSCAFWCANTPTVTTPGHWLTSLSNASGSAMRRPRTSRMCWPLSVISGAPALVR